MKLTIPRTTLSAAVFIVATILTTAVMAEPASALTLPQRISATELKRMLLDLPGTFEIVDIRPPAPYADFSLPGSTNVRIADVIANQSYRNGTVPLVIVDRDGSLAMAVGGILSQGTRRSIRVLHGGLEAYWNDAAVLLAPDPAPALAQAVKAPAAVPAAAKAAVAAPAARSTPTKKSTGC